MRLSRLEAPTGDPALTQALKARAQELARLGLATEAKRGMLTFSPDRRERLRTMELHLDVRKRVMLDRTAARQTGLTKAMTRGIGLGVDR